ncbi:MAG: TonB-dependent receptor, partial [Planctomycetes bacterium]|nr:TonB-dependent receptor [Planctomycetota bacterium]
MRSIKSIVLAVIIPFVVLTMAGPSVAQVVTANIVGTVSDIEGQPLPGVNMTLQNTQTGMTRSLTTDANGKYSFRAIPAQGTYQITAELAGFNSEIQKDLQLHINETATINFRLKAGVVDQFVTVTAQAPLVDIKETTVQQVITEELVTSLPVIGRNYIALTHLAPGVTGQDYWPTTSGQFYWAMNYLVDGGSNFSKWRSAARTYYSGYSLDAIQEIQVLNNQFSVEFGEGMSAINSAITKSGTNEFKGSLYFYDRPGSWDEPSFMTGTKAPFNQQQVGFSLAGPIVKDRAHFFLNYEYRRQLSSAVVIAPEYYGQIVPDKQDEHMVFAKVDFQLTKSDYLTLRYSNDIFNWAQEYGGYNIPGEGMSYVTYVHTGYLSWLKTLSENKINELRLQVASYYDLRKALTNYPDRAAENRYGYAVLGGEAYYADGFGVTPEITSEIFEKFTLSRGNHLFKFGAFAKYTTAEQIQLAYADGIYYFAGSPEDYPDPYLFTQSFALDESLTKINSRDLNWALFTEDEWSVTNRLTLTLGLRYDVQQIFNVKGYTAPPDWNNIQPRLGLAYDLSGNGKSVFRAGFGLFSQQNLSFHYTKGAFLGRDGQVSLTLSPAMAEFPTYPNGLSGFPEGADLPARNIWEIDEHIKNPYSIQTTIGFQQEILPMLSLSVDGIYMTVMDGFSVIDVNAPESTTEPRTIAEADTTRPITPTVNGFRTIYHLGNLGRSWYKALNFKLERRGKDYMILVTYTLSKTTDMLNPWTLPQDSRDIEDDKGPGAIDRRNLLNLAFFYNFPFKSVILRDWQLSGIAKFNSAAPYTETYGTDLWGTGLGNARPYGRNNLRGDPYYNVDIGLSRRISLANKTSLELRIEAFNLFN